MKYVLGLDQGSTKTHAVVAREDGALLALGSAPGGCYTMTGMEQAMRVLSQAAGQAMETGGVGWPDILCAAGGIAGIDYPYEVPLLTSAIAEHMPVPEVLVHNDCIGALWGGTFTLPAVVCCAGTGLNVGAIDENGKILVLGNYCHDLHQGSGALGRDAIHAVCDARIGKGPQTALTEAVLHFLGIEDVDMLLLRDHRKHDINPSVLAPVVFQCARQGDAVADALLCDLAKHMAGYILSAIRLSHINIQADFPVVLSGGMFKGSPPIPQRIIAQRLAQACPKARLVESIYEPVVGGAVMALFRNGKPGWQERLEQSAQALGLVRKTAILRSVT